MEAPFRAVRLVLFAFFAGSASVGAVIATTQTLAAAAGGGSIPLADAGTSLAVDVGAAALFLFLFKRDLDARAKQMARLEREAGLGALRVRLANGRALRVADLRGAARPVVVAGTRAQVDAALAAAAPHREALLGKGVIIVPVALDEAAGASSSSSAAAAPASTPPPSPSRDDLRFIALPVDPAKFAAWFAAQAAAAGADLSRGLYVGLRIDGRVRASGAGVPPFAVFAAQLPPMEWSGFFDGFDGRVL